jgi:ubiquinone/menaquinone biosynthesis C-methylase UbiE
MTETAKPGNFRIQDGVDGDASRLIMVLDLMAANPGVARLRAWAREALDPKPGERALDIGCGLGEEVVALGELVGPAGEAIGIEPNPGIRAEATRRAETAGSIARFIDGEAYRLPFEDATVDVVRCERVWQHIDHPDRAAKEIARVLRPGGRVVVIDTDWATVIVHPGDPAVVEALRAYWLSRFTNPLSGRQIRGHLTAAGLEFGDIGSQALIQDHASIAAMMAQLTSTALESQDITPAQLDELRADLEAGVARGDFHFSVTMFGVLAVTR